MSWADICRDPTFKDLPYKIQTDKWGNIVMSPASNEHGIFQAKIIALLSRYIMTGTIVSECSVQTSQGTKVADVAWASDEFMHTHTGENPYVQAPEICIEILSPSNSQKEMEEKKELYFARGAKEFWICDQEGKLTFYDCTGRIDHSLLNVGIPGQIP